LTTQKLVNWYLADEILNNKEDLQKIIWIGEDPPGEDGGDYIFWWDTVNLELLTQHNDQWFPVSIPPAQAETLRQEIDALYEDTAANRLNIIITQQELDLKVLETKERIDEVEAIANQSTSNCAFLNKDNGFASNKVNTFFGPVVHKGKTSIDPPSNNSSSNTFEIKGTNPGGTVNQPIFSAKNVTQQNGAKRMEIHYTGATHSSDAIATVGFVSNSYISRAEHEGIINALTLRISALEGGT
jgi:hypothetical protein